MDSNGNAETGREYLDLLRKQQHDIWSLESECRGYRVRMIGVGSPDLEHERVSGGMPKEAIDRLIKVEEYLLRINQQYDKLLDMRVEALTLLDMIQDPDQRAVLREYYVRCHSIRHTASIVHLSKSQIARIRQDGVDAFELIFRRVKKGQKGHGGVL
jgi:hypothetical protein